MFWSKSIGCSKKHCETMCICKQTTIECDKNGGVSCSIHGYPTNYLLVGEVNLLQQLDSHSLNLANRGEKIN